MATRKLYVGILAAGASALAITGCSMAHPNAMPSGYTYHQDTYKSAAPPPSPKITAEQRRYMDAAQAEQFRDAVYDLLKRLSGRAGMPPKPVYVLAPDPMTTFYANIDNDLREGMRHLGYAISDVPTGAYVFAYDARLMERPRGYVSDGQPNVDLIIRVFDSIGENARMLTEEAGRYYIQGAELLHIKPSQYSLLPGRDKIMQQAQGFDPAETTPRTAMQMQYEPVKTGETTREKMMEPSPMAPAPQAYQPAHQPMAQPVSRYNPNGPSQAVTIDSNGVSYDDGASYESGYGSSASDMAQPRGSVSRYMDY